MKLTNAGGAVTKSYDYDAFGVEKNPDANDANPFRYCGEYFDAETGTYYLRARYYAPTLGRFTQQDTYKGTVEDPLSLNLYVYCGNSPVTYTDPSGHQRGAGYYYINGVYDWYEDPDAAEFGIDSDTYKIIDSASNRWFAATTYEGRERMHEIAEYARRMFRAGTPLMYGYEKIMNTLHANAETGIAYMEDLWNNTLYISQGGNPYFASYGWFIGMTYNAWNYKYDDNWRVPYSTFDGVDMNELYDDGSYAKNWTAWIYFEGALWSADKIGNINLAYVGTRMGFAKFMIANFATLDKDDASAIYLGISLAEQGW